MDKIETYRGDRARRIREGKDFYSVSHDESIVRMDSLNHNTNGYIYNDTGTVKVKVLDDLLNPEKTDSVDGDDFIRNISGTMIMHDSEGKAPNDDILTGDSGKNGTIINDSSDESYDGNTGTIKINDNTDGDQNNCDFQMYLNMYKQFNQEFDLAQKVREWND
jgi:hypothetical protein